MCVCVYVCSREKIGVSEYGNSVNVDVSDGRCVYVYLDAVGEFEYNWVGRKYVYLY